MKDYSAIALKYCNDIISGKIPSCNYVKLACSRHITDLEKSKSPSYPYRYDKELGDRRCRFSELLTHTKGKWAGKKISLEPHQIFMQTCLFGWVKKKNGKRRFGKAFIELPRKNGKAEWVENLIPTPDGFVSMGEIKVGDYVFSENGLPIEVLSTTDIMYGKPCMEVVFSTGEKIIVAEDHLWATWDKNINFAYSVANPGVKKFPLNWPSWEKENRGGKKPLYLDGDREKMRLLRQGGMNSFQIAEIFGRTSEGIKNQWREKDRPLRKRKIIRTTKEISETLTFGSRKLINHRIPAALPLDIQGEAVLPIKPYVFGYLLGDGDRNGCGRVACDAQDREELIKIFNKDGYNISRCVDINHFYVKGITKCWKRLNLHKEKYIPQIYMRGSLSQRIEVVRGLIDSDGYITNQGSYQFYNINKRLIDDFCELISSLGCIPHTYHFDKRISNKKNYSEAWSVVFYSEILFAKLLRKANKTSAKRSREQSCRHIVAVNPVSSVPVKCIHVDNESGLYLTGRSFIPTHNSIDAATTGLYMLVADGEKGAECYSGATTEKQALEVFRPAWQMAHANSSLREKFGISLSGTPKNPTSIYRLQDMSRFELLVGTPGDGASPHCGIHDEYHESKTSDQVDTIETGMGSREQPLQLIITTAGTDTSLPCYDLHLRCAKILEGTIEDDSTFCIMYTIDPDDKWQDFNVWRKANPNYLISIEEDYLIRKHKETLTDVNKQNINLTKHLNVWTNAGTAWMNMTKWAACSDPILKLSDFVGQPCYCALDLASKIDICALILLFEGKQQTIIRTLINPETGEEEEKEVTQKDFIVFGKYYLPEETIQLAGNDHYIKWVKEGYITETPGARTDFLYIENDLKIINKNHPIIELAFDPREANYLINNVSEWLGSHLVDGEEVSRCVEITQGPQLMSEPMKEVEGRIYSKTLWHDGNPVTTWMMGNVVKKQGRNSGPVKYYYPTKEKNEFKIDGPVSIIMCVSRAMKHVEARSVYDGLSKEDLKRKLRGEM